jgi:hypothetical protein
MNVTEHTRPVEEISNTHKIEVLHLFHTTATRPHLQCKSKQRTVAEDDLT